MSASQRSPITDSPWFWVLVFSAMALAALVAIGPKYGGRQARLERQYQARERILEQRSTHRVNGNTEESPLRTEERGESREFASVDETLVPLWPLAAILSLLVIFSVIMLVRGRERFISREKGVS